jgi:phospholipase D3/4
VKIRIVQSADNPDKNQDTKDLMEMGVAEVRSLNVTRLVGSGILHTKMWIVDGKHFYLGSGNLDWRSLTQASDIR